MWTPLSSSPASIAKPGGTRRPRPSWSKRPGSPPSDLGVRLLQAQGMEDEKAAQAFDAILEDHPESVEALVGSATLQHRLAREAEEKARDALDRALALDSLNAPGHLLYPDLHDGAEEARREAVDRALAADSLSAEAHSSLAGLLRSDGDLGGAFDEYLVVLRLDPFDDSVHRSLGNGGSFKSWGRYPPLEDEEVPPDLADLLDRADAFLLQRDLGQAEETYRQALELYPGYAAALLGLGSVSYYRGEYERGRGAISGSGRRLIRGWAWRISASPSLRPV